MASKEPIPLTMNCGYARSAIRELTVASRAKHGGVHKANRAKDFRELFDIPSYQIPTNYFESNQTKKTSIFDKHCEYTCKFFLKKWNPTAKRVEYTNTFSIENWKSLPENDKQKHTISNCKACFNDHETLQKCFPEKPIFMPSSQIINLQGSAEQTEKELGKKILKEINVAWQEKFEHSFTQTLPKMFPETNLAHKKTKSEKKAQVRQQKRQIVKEVNQKLADKATISVLAEAESLSSYSRKRFAYSYDSPRPAKRFKSHSPNEQNLGWDIDNAIEALKNFPQNQKINWSEMARELNIPQKNGGQVLKDLAIKNNIDINKLEHKPENSEATPRLRRCKTKLTGGEISMPCLPTRETIIQDRNHLINSGELSIGEPCSPQTLQKTVANEDGTIETRDVVVYGRKIPLLELRKQLLKKHQEYMRLTTIEEIQKLSKEDILQFLNSYSHTTNPDDSLQDLQKQLWDIQHTRNLAIWHDHSTILNTGYIMFAVKPIYDAAVYLTEEEYKQKTGKSIPSIQKKIEIPEIYMIAPSSSSPSDQLALISDRVECLQELSIPLTATNGQQIHDKLRFFYGDKPAAQFERGTQIGGIYKCGSCGCKNNMMSDLSHALNKPWRSLANLQSIVTSGKYGKTPGQLKPLENLKIDQLKEELRVRGENFTEQQLKPELSEKLSSILQGAQRVATLLTGSPTQSLTELNLQHYEILDCEPLHDVKGHLVNLIAEIPHLLKEPLKSECGLILKTTIPKQKVSGAVLRTAAIKLLLKLFKSSVNSQITKLLETIVRMTELLYMPALKRCPRNILRLYNCSWLHHELCRELFPTLKSQSLSHFFGIYLHALVVHAPIQFQTMPLSSIHTENEERLFCQAKRISNRATNRKTDNVLPTILVSIQARQKLDSSNAQNYDHDSIVQTVASKLPPYTGTIIDEGFIEKRLSSWQTHLQRISTFLEYGKGTWWEEEGLQYKFLDSDNDPPSHPQGPKMMHYRDTSINEVQTITKTKWNCIVKNKTELPTPSIQLFDNKGDYMGTRYFKPPKEQETPPTSTNRTPTTLFPEITEEEFHRFEMETETTPSFTIHSPENEHPPEAEEVNVSVVVCTEETEGNCNDQQVDKCYQTKAAKLISKAIGTTTSLTEFDSLRAKLKAENERPNKKQRQEYTALLQTLYQSVLLAKKEAKKNVRKYEQQYFNTHSIFPETQADYKLLRKKLDFVKYLCSMWSHFSI